MNLFFCFSFCDPNSHPRSHTMQRGNMVCGASKFVCFPTGLPYHLLISFLGTAHQLPQAAIEESASCQRRYWGLQGLTLNKRPIYNQEQEPSISTLLLVTKQARQRRLEPNPLRREVAYRILNELTRHLLVHSGILQMTGHYACVN